MYWKILYALLRAIWPVLKLLQISDSVKPDMDRIYHLSYKAHFAIKNSKEYFDDVTFFVTSLINAKGKAYATYSV